MAEFGLDHRMVFTRMSRSCNICRDNICGDFLRCKGCPDVFDMCSKCAITTRALKQHTGKHGSSHNFSTVQWDTSTPLKKPVIIDAPNTDAFLNWKCDSCQSNLRGKALVCLECSSAPRASHDFCYRCSDRGAAIQHARRVYHTYMWCNLRFEGENAPQGVTRLVPETEAEELPPAYADLD